MSYTLLAESFPVARKGHKCIWCGQAISVGDKHRHERSVYDSQFQDQRWHPECDDAFRAEIRHGGGEFEPFGNERPTQVSDGDQHDGLWQPIETVDDVVALTSKQQLKNCPFCGDLPRDFYGSDHYGCSNKQCGAYMADLPAEQWNRRPAPETAAIRSVHVTMVPWCQCCASRVEIDHVCACEQYFGRIPE